MSIRMTQADLLTLANKIDLLPGLTLPERIYLCHELRVQGGHPLALEVEKQKMARMQVWLDTLCDENNATMN